MPAQCSVCGEQRTVKNKISHSNRNTKRIQRRNLQRVHANIDGVRTHVRVCTRCLRSGKIAKAA